MTHEEAKHPQPHTGHGQEHGHEAHGHTHGVPARSAGPLRFLWALLRPHSHDAADSVDGALAGSVEGIHAVRLSLIVLTVTSLLQVGVFLVSGSVALLADTIHNFADASTALPLWLAFSLGRRPPNRRYTYGYGRAEDLAGVCVVLLIAISSVVAGWQSIQRLVHPEPIANLGWVAAAGVVGFLGNEWVAQFRIRSGKRIGSAALIADGYHARTDGFTSLAVPVGVLGVWVGFPLADPLVGLAITVVILMVLKGAIRQIWSRLMDAIEPTLLEQAEVAAGTAEGVERVEAVRARWIGHSIHAEAEVVANSELTLAQAHAVAERARHAMLHAVPKLATVTVHVDPCGHAGQNPHADLAHHQPRFDGPVDR